MTDEITAYLDAQPEPQRTTLTAMRATISRILSRAEEGLAYGMPSWRVDGTAVAGIAGASGHCAFFPHSGTTLETVGSRAGGLRPGEGHRPLPGRHPAADLPRAHRHPGPAGRGSATPDAKGFRREFYDDGGLKAKGRMKDGELHGPWQWWRKDGSLLRSGSFDRGRQVGEWTTYDRDSAPVKVTGFGR